MLKDRIRKFARFALLALALLLAAVIWWLFCGGVSHREVMEAVQSESARVRELVDARADVIEAKIDAVDTKVSAVDAKLNRIESKLDQLMDFVAPRLPDGMKPSINP